MKAALVRTAIFTLAVPGTVLIYVPYRLLEGRTGGFGPGPGRYPGAVLVLLGAAVYLRCAWNFAAEGFGTPAPIDPPKELVVRGLYRHVRNPMYVGVVGVLLGEALFFGARVLLEYAAVVFGFFFLFVLAYEEPALRRKFGATYERYCAEVPRWIPRLRPWRRRDA